MVTALDLLFALTAGFGTFFSPCAYPLLPGYVGYYVSQTEGTGRSLGGPLLRGITAGVGIFLTFAVSIGLVFTVGYHTVAGIELLEPIVGVALLVLGALVAVDRAPSLSVPLPKRRSSVLGFGVFGAGYAVAAIGCVVPLFVGVVGRALALPTGGALLVLGTYVGTVLVLMVALTVVAGVGVATGAGRLSARASLLKRAAGVVMVAAGIGQLAVAGVV